MNAMDYEHQSNRIPWEQRPWCGKCGGAMTPENARLRPELFLHDACLPDELKDCADQRTVLNVRPLRGLIPVHEGNGLYVIARERDNSPDNYEVIAENLTAEHARQICDAVNGRVG